MNELQELRIIVDCAIDGAVVRRLHASGCRCALCARRRRRDDITTVGPREADPFFVRRVEPLVGSLPPGTQRRPLAIGERVTTNTRTGLRQLRAQLWTRPGVFLSGANEQQARRWAIRQVLARRGIYRPAGGKSGTINRSTRMSRPG
jgi:hypothetical protein